MSADVDPSRSTSGYVMTYAGGSSIVAVEAVEVCSTIYQELDSLHFNSATTESSDYAQENRNERRKRGYTEC